MVLLRRLAWNLIRSSSFSSSSSPSSSFSSPCALKVGDVLRRSRIFSEQDVIEYSRLSHDSNPLHFDRECARNSGFEDRIVHGMLVAALFPRIIAFHFPGAVYVSQSLQFKLPVYIGEEIVGQVNAINRRQHKSGYIAKFSTKCLKNGELLVIDGEAMAVLPTLIMEHAHHLADRAVTSRGKEQPHVGA